MTKKTARRDPRRPFSWVWVGLSVVLFMAVELFIGGWLSGVLADRSISHMLSLRIELLLSLVSFLVGGFIIGVVSPGLRIIEPGVGAAISVVLTFMISLFTPLRLFAVQPGRMLWGGAIAFLLGVFGAHLGERLTGN